MNRAQTLYDNTLLRGWDAVGADSPSALMPYGLYLFVAAVTIHLLWNKFQAGLYPIPGPTLAGYTGFWRLVNVWKGRSQWTAIELHRKHGPLVRLAPNVVSVGDPKAVSTIYGLKSGFLKMSTPAPPPGASRKMQAEESPNTSLDCVLRRHEPVLGQGDPTKLVLNP
jgi:hypothetical protein